MDVSCTREVELLLRWTDAAHSAAGYECLWDQGGGIQIVRWNGAIGNFTVLSPTSYGSWPPIADGDTLKAAMVGNLITMYRNGVKRADLVDNSYSTGNPGIGFFRRNCGNNSDYGYTYVTATDAGTPLPVVVSVSVTPATASIEELLTRQFTATATYDDASTQTVTASAAWSSTNNSVATVNGSGLATGVTTGQAGIIALYSGFRDTATLTVTAYTGTFLKKINFQPSASTVPGEYEADNGLAYTSGQGYGWASAVPETRERGVDPDPRYDTFVKTYSATDWRLDLPAAGLYRITVVMGDPSYATANRLVFGTQTLIDAAASTSHTTLTDTLTVTGSQLVLSVTGAICYIDVESLGGGTGKSAARKAPGLNAGQGMPNPFRSMMILNYSLNTASTVQVRIYDQAGRVVRVIAEGTKAPGRHALTWDGRDQAGRTLANGVYIAKIAVNSVAFTRRLVLLR
jgi:hypothetical protein